MNRVLYGLICALLLTGCGAAGESERVEKPDRNAQIRAELVQMADDFLNYRPMKGFAYEMDLAEAYRWQDEMAVIMAPSLGRVVGYKTGGHNAGPGFATFPPGGVRGLMLEGMMRPSGTVVRLEQFRRGFLEADIAFRVGSSAINGAQSDLEILQGLDALIPFAEIPDPYYEEGTRSVNGTIVANMGSRMSFTGEPVPLEASEATLEKLSNLTFAVLDGK